MSGTTSLPQPDQPSDRQPDQPSDRQPDQQPGQPAGDEVGIRRRLVEGAARLLSEEGPAALTTRKVAAAAGTSTMAVYTHFGSMPALVREIVTEGFARLADHMTRAASYDDPEQALIALAQAYRDNALENPHLYQVMFGATSLGGYRLTEADRDIGHYTFVGLRDAVAAAIAAGSVRAEDPDALAGQLWSALHGFVMLELAGYQCADNQDLDRVLWPMLDRLTAPDPH